MRKSRFLARVLCLVVSVALPVAADAAQKNSRKHQAQARTQTTAVKKPAPAAKAVKTVARKTTSARATKVKAVERDFDASGMPMLRSTAFMVQEVHSGRVLLQKNANVAVPIASITKLMTAMVVLDAHQSLSEVIEVTDDDVDRLKGSSSRLPVGTRLSREDMLHLALMASENRAASALARNYPGGLHAFIEAANVKTKMMGLSDTHFYDPTGLNKNNVSSAHDLAIMVANASRYPLIREFSTTPEYTADLREGRPRTFHNTNSLVKSPDWQIDVQKTGFINESGKCLVMQAWVGDKQLAIVLLDSSGRYTRIADANRIRKWLESAGIAGMLVDQAATVARAGQAAGSY